MERHGETKLAVCRLCKSGRSWGHSSDDLSSVSLSFLHLTHLGVFGHIKIQTVSVCIPYVSVLHFCLFFSAIRLPLTR